MTGTTDSGAGSSIGLAASVVRELAQQSAKRKEDDNDVDTLIATATETGEAETAEAEKDTTISRSQAETRKSVPSLMPDELEMAPSEENQKPKSSLVAGTSASDDNDEEAPAINLKDLEKELAPLTATADPIMNANMNAGTRLQSREPEKEGVPAWMWIVLGVGVLAVLIIVALIAIF